MPSASISDGTWWLAVENDTPATIMIMLIVALVVPLYNDVPHAAATERSFSLMEWVNACRHASQTIGTLKRLTKVCIALNGLLDKPRRKHPVKKGAGSEVTQLPTQLLKAELDTQNTVGESTMQEPVLTESELETSLEALHNGQNAA
ncbi:hypothetical protein WJX74_006107 [Apatococcus lobatus]|uniref:Uncharacterized protein n=1 Tax=Apatococcus lobatus TaxID=904363 RepID=A0AAW1Q9D2_9CHLO